MRHSLPMDCLLAFVSGAVALFAFDAAPEGYAIWGGLSFAPLLTPAARRHDAQALVRAITPLLIGAALAGLYAIVHASPEIRQYVLRETSEYDGEQYYAVISTLFALLSALILVKGIELFDRLNVAIGEEATKIRSIVEFVYYFEEEDGEAIVNILEVKARTQRIRKLMLVYCNGFLADPSSSDHARATEILRRTTREVGALDCHDENDRLALAETMRAVNELFAIRARRLAGTRGKIPRYLMLALVFMSLSLIFPFFVGAPENHPYAQFYIFVLSTFCAFVMVLLQDISAPFNGFWRVDLTAFQTLREDLRGFFSEAREGAAPRRLRLPAATATKRIQTPVLKSFLRR